MVSFMGLAICVIRLPHLRRGKPWSHGLLLVIAPFFSFIYLGSLAGFGKAFLLVRYVMLQVYCGFLSLTHHSSGTPNGAP
jgi:hypothetical protein